MRAYDSERDYHILLAAARRLPGPSLATIRAGLNFAGIVWPARFNDDRSPVAIAIERDIHRAWIECGWEKPYPGEPEPTSAARASNT